MSENAANFVLERVDTKRHIANVTAALLKEVSVEKLSVNMIIEASGTSRTTFYRYFMDKYDVISRIFFNEVDELIDEYSNFYERSIQVHRYVCSRREMFISALSYEGQNCLVEHIAKRSRETYVEKIKQVLQTEEIPKELEESMDFFFAGFVWAWKYWVSHKMQESPEYFADLIRDNMPERLRFYIES